MGTPVCKDCIQAAALGTQTSSGPCDGYEITFTPVGGRLGTSETVILSAVPNTFSLNGYDYTFTSLGTGVTYTIINTGGQWVVINNLGEKVFYSTATGGNNNLCPPISGWTDQNGEFLDFSIGITTVPGPSGPCSVTNGTFDSTTNGWSVVNGAWDATYGGVVRFDTALLSSLSQANVLTIGETYVISFDFITTGSAGYCTPAQANAAYIKVYAGTNVYAQALSNTNATPVNVEVELTCEGNTTLKIEVYDPSQCYGTIAGGKGRLVDNVCAQLKTNVTDPTGPSPLPSVEYIDNAEVPSQINGMDYNSKLLEFQECLATKGTTFYNKIVGGVKCDYRELTKLKLIIELLAQKNQDRALDCVYDRQTMPTALYQDLPTGTLTITSANQKVVVITGDISQFESFDLNIPALSNFTSEIIDAVYNSTLNQTTVTVKDNFPSTISNTPYAVKFESEVATSYLETFINFANRFCADCIKTPSPTTTETVAGGINILAPEVPLIGESGTPLTTEFNQQIIL